MTELSDSVEWGYDENEIGTVMSSGKIFGHTMQMKNCIKCNNNSFCTSIASIGMVIMNKDFRGFDLGKEATQKCINPFLSDVSIMLIATEDGKPLYEKMFFVSNLLPENLGGIKEVLPTQGIGEGIVVGDSCLLP
ncbi:hypothetical protein [Rossellomorea aquimaris]|uniref:Uncharacterized protein n=1 Tax=Rossellomorea aquimaris TaxID=189382 RepID=A0A366ESF8_9BACI|nr:hypothetical protein [Rossellomorea aquimaris]RBP05327.1 hypothetical protein DET59_10444 [Rossellomorea aquimaris]